jgi:hypothetical protein
MAQTHRLKPSLLRPSLLLLLILAGGCRTSETTSVVVSDGAVLGSLAGQISTIVDSMGHITTDRSVVTITLDGTPYHTTASSTGAWIIDSLPPMTYSLTASASGFDAIHLRDIRLVAGAANTLWQAIFFVQPPKFVPTLDALIMPTNSTSGTLYGHFSSDAPSGVQINLLVLVSHRMDLRIEDPESYSVKYTVSLNPYTAKDSERVFTYSLSNSGSTLSWAASGDTIAIKLYPYFMLSTVPDPNGGPTYLGYGPPSNVLSAIKK